MTITAPYGFVPLSDKVVQPEWLACETKDGKVVAPPVHDVPFEDGLCGTFELEIEAETPIFIRGTDKDKPELPFQLSDGRYAIPGTAMRGALRNIVEIISFSRFSRVNDHRYAVRDLNNRHLYGQYMADIVKDPRTGKGEPMPLVNAGWLTRQGQGDEATYQIEVCDFAKIEYRSLVDVSSQKGVRNFKPGEKQSSVNKYVAWGNAGLDVEASVAWKRPDKVGSRRMLSQFGVAKPAAGQSKGTIVMTGQPSRWVPDQMGRRPGSGSAKHHDFVFFPKRSEPIIVPIQVFQDFEFAHSDRGQQNNLGKSQTPNEEWKFWEDKMEARERVPVFFLANSEGKRVESFGLAMMFRLPYKHSIHEAIRNVSRAHLDPETRLDFAEGLFGTVREDKDGRNRDGGLALKGRVGISHALVRGSVQPEKTVTAVLGAPKASYYPNYVEQAPGAHGAQPGRDSSNKPLYQTWMDPGGAPRGWKRYRALTETFIPKPPSGADGRPLDLSKVGTKFRPLPAGTKFVAHVDVHNLKSQELGALLWAIQLGGDDNARHTLGMARPLGFGRSRFSLKSHDIRDMRQEKVDLSDCQSSFEAWMDTQVKGWKSSPQIKEMLALSHPVSPETARYQRLDPGQRVNEFVDAKKDGLALPSVVKHEGLAVGVPALRATAMSSGSLQQGAVVRGRVLAKLTKKGGPMFEVLGQEGILHPTSAPPPTLSEGDEHMFTLMATGKPLSLKWVDPSAPPPAPPKPQPKGGPNRGGGPGKPGFRR